MKRTFLALLFIVNLCTAKGQDNYSSEQAKQMLKEFYTSYFAVLDRQFQPTIITYKLDSLRSKYCTKELYKKLGRSGMDNDKLIAGDGYTTVDILNKTLNIAKDPTAENDFVVSYMSHVRQVGKPADLKIILQLTVEKDAAGYKIAAVSAM